MVQAPVFPVVLAILDGWGHSETKKANAIATAKTSFRCLFYSGKSVSIDKGQILRVSTKDIIRSIKFIKFFVVVSALKVRIKSK